MTPGMYFVIFSPPLWLLLVTVPLLIADARRGYQLVRLKKRPRKAVRRRRRDTAEAAVRDQLSQPSPLVGAGRSHR